MKKKTKKATAKHNTQTPRAALRRQLELADDALFFAVEAIEELARAAHLFCDVKAISELMDLSSRCAASLHRAAFDRGARLQ